MTSEHFAQRIHLLQPKNHYRLRLQIYFDIFELDTAIPVSNEGRRRFEAFEDFRQKRTAEVNSNKRKNRLKSANLSVQAQTKWSPISPPLL